MTIVYLIKSIFGPELYRVFKNGHSMGRNYNANNLEYYSDTVISLFRGFYVFCKWTSPVILSLAYSRNYFTIEGLYVLTRLSCIFGIVLIIAYIARGMGRYVNVEYRSFLEAYTQTNIQLLSNESNNGKNIIAERKKFLSRFDFEMKHWLADFVCKTKPPNFKLNEPHRFFHNNSSIDTIKFFIWRCLSAMCVDTFGLRMMYPGVVLQNLIKKPLQECRSKLIEQMKAQRAIIETADSYRNKIDTVFVDQRNTIRYSSSNKIFSLSSNPNAFNNNGPLQQNGAYLVICCDGNASFYENGIFQIPVENGFSTLGWNYPGFGQSTGLPYPHQLTSAADAVMQYAFSLGFKTEQIILFSWSIGGFAVGWLANQYPDVKAIVLDACFDNIIPLAQQQMPQFATSTNRGNDLLLSTLQNRYPHIVNNDTMPFIRTWLSAKSDIDRTRILASYGTNDPSVCEAELAAYVKKQESNKVTYPITLGDGKDDDLSRDTKQSLALYLANKYMLNYESSHCQPLLKEHFSIPWSETNLV